MKKQEVTEAHWDPSRHLARQGVSEYHLPAPFDKELFDFQKTAEKLAVRHLEKRGGAMIGDVVGLGKVSLPGDSAGRATLPCMVGGFQSALERDVLKLLLPDGGPPIVMVWARGMWRSVPVEYRASRHRPLETPLSGPLKEVCF